MVVIVDYNAGNLRSVQRACDEQGVRAEITHDPNAIVNADRVIFPGVGAAGSAMKSIRATGVDESLRKAFDQGTPILGICMGLQISFEHSEEDDQKTLGLLDGNVRRFELSDPMLKIPHMGWNEVEIVKPHPVLKDVAKGDEFYFVHAYYPAPANETNIYAIANYEREFSCAVGRRNFLGVQFHPEKSGRVGLQLLANFMRWDGSNVE